MTAPFFDIPPLFNTLCVFMGLAFMVLPFMWLGNVCRREDVRQGHGLVRAGMSTVIRCFFLIVSLSFIYGLAVGKAYYGFITDACWLFPMVFGYYRYAELRAPDNMKGIFLAEAGQQVLLLAAVAAFCALVFALAWGSVNFSTMVGSPYGLESAVALVGALVIGGVFYAYQRAVQARPDAVEVVGGIYGLLWPVAVAILLFIVPLFLHQLAHDEEMYRKFNPPQTFSSV